MRYRHRDQHASKLGAGLAFLLHAAIIAAFLLLAVREGMLGTPLKKIAVTIVPKEKKTEPPQAAPPQKPPPQPEREPERTEPVKLATTTPPPLPDRVIPPSAAVPSAAPPASELPSFDFEGGHTVETSSNPRKIYKGFVEYTLRSAWKRPEDVSDLSFAAEVELGIDSAGRITSSEWLKGSGNLAWDNSVRQVVVQTKSIGRPPPPGFPDKVVVRFDVLPETDALIP